jgi:hypothetical protein
VIDLEQHLRAAVGEFWKTRISQAQRGASSDRGSRSAVTGGAQMNGFVNLVRALLIEDARRYEILLTKLIRERLYNSACLLLSGQEMGSNGSYVEPSEKLGLANFARSLVGHALSFMQEE